MPLYGYPDGLSYGFHRIWPSGPIRVYGKRHGNPGTSENVSTITTTKSPTKEMKVMIGGPGLGSKQTNSGYALSSTFVGIVIILILNLIIN